jgi:23S rRNA G2069 N7-methylase RlmK/C1962 C5-methylase RlmI
VSASAKHKALGEMLANRIAKNQRRLRAWATREHISCYRVYDTDIPEIPLAVDTYDGEVVVSDLRRFRAGEAEEQDWLDAACLGVKQALVVGDAQVHVRQRERMRQRQEGHQYERLADAQAWKEVGEAGHRFWVNLSDYLDTGLFLDHRTTRRLVADEAKGRRVLNLFCYTGSFTVYAARGGAAASTSVDLSSTYLDWARRNWASNDMSEDQHTLVRSDVRRFLDDTVGARQRFDLAVVDPPTFSNSKRMDYTWDIQRDHGALLAEVAQVMAPGAVIWFSTNRRRFSLEPGRMPEGTTCVDMTARTIPPDFRDAKVHRVWRMVLPS